MQVPCFYKIEQVKQDIANYLSTSLKDEFKYFISQFQNQISSQTIRIWKLNPEKTIE